MLYRQSLACRLRRLRFLADIPEMTLVCEVDKIWLFFKQQECSNPLLRRSSNHDLSLSESVRRSVHLLLTFHLIIYWYEVLISFFALRSHCNYKELSLMKKNVFKEALTLNNNNNEKSSQWTQFMQLREEAWKKFRTSTGFFAQFIYDLFHISLTIIIIIII